ncbi:MAG: CoA transferase [Thermoleophilia bacterium]|nr:CoA transferase [Thermoleophilia bacterium]MDH3724782.1 CoA transferase [Thermoleophilia bacterium]
MSGAPLEGIRVVDLTHHLGGPLATMALAQLGADVVKVEAPGGDEWRSVDDVAGESRLFHSVNRDKRGVVLDLKTPDGRSELLRLVDRADVLVHSFSPGVVDRLGVGADDLSARHPRLVYCSLSAFGPHRGRGSDIAVQAESGLIAANDGRIVPLPIHDTIVPWIMVSGILAALIERERSGRGQVVETSLLEAAGALAAHRSVRDESGEPLFNRFVGALYRTYPTADGDIAIACYAPRLQERLLEALGLAELLDDPRFSDLESRARHTNELAELISARLRADTAEGWCRLLRDADLPHGVVAAEPLSLLDHPDARALGLVVEMEDPTLGPELVLAPPLRFSRTPAATRRPAPRLGEHAAEVLSEWALE